MSVGPSGLVFIRIIPGAARFALAPGYLMVAPSTLREESEWLTEHGYDWFVAGDAAERKADAEVAF